MTSHLISYSYNAFSGKWLTHSDETFAIHNGVESTPESIIFIFLFWSPANDDIPDGEIVSDWRRFIIPTKRKIHIFKTSKDIISGDESGKSYSSKRKVTATHNAIKDSDPEANTIMDQMEDGCTVP